MSFNPFESTEAWETSLDNLLPVGNHAVKIVEAEGGTTSNQNPQITLKFENDSGSIRAWEAYHSDFLSKIVALYQAAEVQLPQPGEFDPGDNCRLSDDCIDRLRNRWVGIVVREEDDRLNPGQKRSRVKGYVPVAKLGGTVKAPAQQFAASVSVSSDPGEPDIPF